jgi:hypothetical protein
VADHFYGAAVSAGIGPAAITKGTSTGGFPVELRVTDGTANLNKTTLLVMLRAIEGYITTDSALP